MIGFNAIGQLGRLGNQMFQFAALKGIARNRGYEYCFPPTRNQNEWTDHQLFNPFKLINTGELNCQFLDADRKTVSEDSFSFNQELFDTCPDWVNLQGFFQTEKYFKHIKDEIRGDFSFRDEIYTPSTKMISGCKDPIALHIRRTDYLTNPNHSIVPMDYYLRALNEFDSDRDVLIFSDDPDWCLNNILFEGDRFLVSETGNQYLDMCMMTLCKGHIIANSSFSWWGAWLSNSEKVIAPKGWFEASKNQHLNVSDLIPEEWEKF